MNRRGFFKTIIGLFIGIYSKIIPDKLEEIKKESLPSPYIKLTFYYADNTNENDPHWELLPNKVNNDDFEFIGNNLYWKENRVYIDAQMRVRMMTEINEKDIFGNKYLLCNANIMVDSPHDPVKD